MSCSICGSVVVNQYLEILIGLLQDIGQGLANRATAVINGYRDIDRNRHRRPCCQCRVSLASPHIGRKREREREPNPTACSSAGAPRSGTVTFVQLLLYASGDFASAQETHLFPAFLGRLEEIWDRFEERGKMHRDVGLPTVIPRTRFDEIMREMALAVMRDIGRRRPEAPWVLEKTPENILVWPLITRLLPKARFITVIRDPRSVVAEHHRRADLGREVGPIARSPRSTPRPG